MISGNLNEVLESALIALYCTFLVWWIFNLSKRIVKKYRRGKK